MEKIIHFAKKRKISILVFFVYTAISFYYCLPLLQDIDSAIVPGDGLFTYWTISWNIHSILHDPANLFNTNIFFPNQNTLSYSEGLFVPAFIALPLFGIFRNMIVAYNLMIFFSYILAAFGAFRLARYYTKNNYASFIAGLIFGFATFRLVSIGHFQNIMIWWMPFATLALQKYLDTKKRKQIIFFALLFSAQMLSCWNMGAFFALFIVFLLTANWKTIHKNFRPMLKDGIIALVIIAVLVGPFAYPYFKLNRETHFSYNLDEISNGSADIGGYIFPLPGTSMSRLTSFLNIQKQHWSENFNFLGYFSIFVLLFYFLFSKKRIQEKPFFIYIFGIIIFIVLSFGPKLKFLFSSLNIPLPYILLVPIMGFVRTPSRIASIVLLCLSVAIAYIINSQKVRNKLAKYILFFTIPAFILFEFWVPLNAKSFFLKTTCPDEYLQIKNDSSVKAVVEMPIHEKPDGALPYVFYSTCHWKPIFNGFSGYFPKKYSKYSQKMRDFPETKSIDFMKKLGISHVLLHLNLIPAEKRESLIDSVKNEKNLDIEYQDENNYLIELK